MTDDDLILVTAATGNTGAPTVKILRDAGRRVRALVHTADERSEALTALGAEVVEGDLLDLHSTSSALGERRLLLLPGVPGHLASGHGHLRPGRQRSRRQGGGQHVPDLGAPRSQK